MRVVCGRMQSPLRWATKSTRRSYGAGRGHSGICTTVYVILSAVSATWFQCLFRLEEGVPNRRMCQVDTILLL